MDSKPAVSIVIFLFFSVAFIPTVLGAWTTVDTWSVRVNSTGWHTVETWTVTTKASGWITVETWSVTTEAPTLAWSTVGKWTVSTKATFPTTVIIVSPPDGTSFSVLDFPYKFDVRVGDVILHKTCWFDPVGKVDYEYCDVDASWTNPYFAFLPGVSNKCEAQDDYPDYNISSGDVLVPKYCEAYFKNLPDNILLLKAKPSVQTSFRNVSVVKEDIKDGTYTFDFTVDDFKDFYDGGYSYGSWDVKAYYYDISLDTSVTDQITITIEEPPVPPNVSKSVRQVSSDFTGRWSTFDQQTNQLGKFMFSLIVMIAIGMAVGYYGGYKSGMGGSFVIGLMFFLWGWMPSWFGLVLVLLAGVFIVRVFMSVLAEE